MRGWLFAVLGLAACGRIGFDATASDHATRSTLVLDRQLPTEPLVDFPLPIVLGPERADLAVLTADTLRAFSAAGDELALEIETLGPPVVAWVRVPSIDATTPTRITIEYGGEPRTRDDVWDAGYLGVWHMTEPGRDSSPHARSSRVTLVTPAPGFLGGAAAYVPSDESCIAVQSFAGLAFGAGPVSMSAWVYPRGTEVGEYHAVLQRQLADDSGNDDLFLGTDPDDNVVAALHTENLGSPAHVGTTPLPSNGWHHLAYTFFMPDEQTSTSWVDGAIMFSRNASGVPSVAPRPLFIGCGRNFPITPIDVPDDDYFDGLIDEVRLELHARNAAWITYTYRAHRDEVITYGPIER